MADTPQQLRVFVSHSHQDNDFCHAIVAALRDAGADVWYDQHDMGSGRLGPTIEREVRARPVFVVILSPAAVRSQWVEDETRWAYGLLRKDPTRVIQPILAAAVAEDDIWLFLQDFKRIEADGRVPFTIQEAANRLVRALGLSPRGAAPTPVAHQPTNSLDELLTLGKAMVAQSKFEEAEQVFKVATQIAPNSFDAWSNLGHVLNEREQWEEARKACDRALALDEKQAWVWNNKGWALAGLGDYKGTLAACERALELNPNYARAWRRKGYALYKLKRRNAALAAYEHALLIYPTYARAWRQKASVLYALGRTAEAEAAEKRARELGWTGE